MNGPVANNFEQDNEAEQRRRELILSNSLVGGIEEIAEFILQKSEPQTMPKGTQLIKEGVQEDSVFFILNGSVSVWINGKHIDDNHAPGNVGELAARRAGNRRTADVFAVTDHVDVLVLSGLHFRKLLADYPSFNENLALAIENMNAAKIAQLGVMKPNDQISWTTLSAVVAGLAAVGSGVLAWLAGISGLGVASALFAAGVCVFIAMLLVNPDLAYRNMFRFSGISVVMLVVYGSISFAFSVDGMKQKIPFLIDFNVSGEMKASILAVSVFALIIVCLISAHYDDRREQRK